MGFFTGRASFLRFKVNGAAPRFFDEEHLDRLRDQAAYWGWAINAKYGEAFYCRETVGLKSFRDVF